MSSTADTPTTTADLDSAAGLLAHARTRRADAQAADADVFVAAAAWAEQHPAESICDAAGWGEARFGEHPVSLAGPGALLVAEFCLAEFAAALGMTTDSGKALIAQAVETRHRLPRLWARVVAGQVPAWRARRIAERTMALSFEAAGFVDAQVAAYAHKVGYAVTERLVTEAVARFMPAQAREDARKAADGRHVRFRHDTATLGGTTFLDAELDAADALDLDAALIQGAAVLKAAGCAEDLDVRRAMAVGDLARNQLALDLAAALDPDACVEPAGRKLVKPRRVVLHVHLSDAALQGATGTTRCEGSGGIDLARLETGRRLLTAEQVRTWCANPDTAVTVRPVIDTTDLINVEAYEVPDRLAAQTQERDHSCVFPWCTRPARTADCDHVIPHQRGGPTCSCNLAPLCRRHHRLKTHATWTYTVISPGTYLWSSPHGYQFLRDHTGTLDVTTTRPLAPPGPIHHGDPPGD